MPNTTEKVIAVMQDLMFMVRIQESAKRAGLETVVVKTKPDALAKAAEAPLLVVIDLNHAAGEPLELIRALKADPATESIHLLAFVSHVQTDLRSAAVAAGCDTVVARSAFVQTLPDIIQRCLSSRSPT
jgi:CheY-like chemotaxis protein